VAHFPQAHWSALVAADFFTTEVWTARGRVTYYTAFVIRDPNWTSAMEAVLNTVGVRVVRTPPASPNCDARAERFVRDQRGVPRSGGTARRVASSSAGP